MGIIIIFESGKHMISVSKSGYISPSSRSVTLGLDEQKNLSDPFILTNDQATVWVLYLTRMAMRFRQPYALQMEVRSMSSKVMDQVPINLQYHVLDPSVEKLDS